jgi:hypothetical protein
MRSDLTTISCKVCGTDNTVFRMKCHDCGQYLGQIPKKGNKRSKQSKGRDNYKRPPIVCFGNKQKYTLGGVKVAQKRVYKNRGAQMRYYHCNDCKAFHLTKSRG